MRSATRLGIVVFVALLGGFWARPAPPSHRSGRPIPAAPLGPATTVEPAPPLVIDLRLGPVERAGRGAWRARLEVVLSAGPDLRDLDLDLVLPEGVQAAGDDLPGGPRPARLGRGEVRLYTLPLEVSRAGALPLAIEAGYSLPDGRTLRGRQGVTLLVESPRPPGRRNAGAYEVMAVPLDEWLAR